MSQYHGLLSHYQQHMYDRDLVDEKVSDEFEDHRPLGGNGPVLFIPKNDPYSLSPPPTPEYTYNFGGNILAKAFYEGSKSQQLYGLEHSWDNLIPIEDTPEKPTVGKPGQVLTADGWSDPQEPSSLPQSGQSHGIGIPMTGLEMEIFPPIFVSKFQAWSRFVGDRRIGDDVHVEEVAREEPGDREKTVVREKMKVDYLEIPLV